MKIKTRLLSMAVLLGVIFSAIQPSNRALMKSSKAKNYVQPIPIEFKNVSEEQGWSENNFSIHLNYPVQTTIENQLKMSYDLYVPQALLSKADSRVMMTPGCNLWDNTKKPFGYDDNRIHIGYNLTALKGLIIKKTKKKYKAYYWNGKKNVTEKKYTTIKSVGKFIQVKIKNLPLETEYVDDNDEKKSNLGLNATIAPSISIYGCGVSKKTDMFLDSFKLYSGKQTLISDSFSTRKCDVICYFPDGRVTTKPPVVFNSKKISKNTKVKSNHMLDASDEEFVDIKSESATRNTITSDTKKTAAKLPAIKREDACKWRGIHLANLQNISGPMRELIPHYFYEEEIRDIAKEGFNCIRVHFDTRIMFSQNSMDETVHHGYTCDGTHVNLRVLKNFDDLVSWGIKYKVHIIFDVLNAPGHICAGDPELSRELFTTGSKAQTIFYDYWEMMAQRYADIPPSVLSFNLLNEPPHIFNDEVYVDLMKNAIARINKWDKNRLLIIDMFNYGTRPVEEITGENIIQAVHPYNPREFTLNKDKIRIEYPKDGKERLDEELSAAHEFSVRTGTPVIIGEFNCTCIETMEDTIKYYNDVFSLTNQYNMGWIIYSDGCETSYFHYYKETFREGGTYIPVSDGGQYVSKELRTLIKAQNR